jgi:hypothetical protein
MTMRRRHQTVALALVLALLCAVFAGGSSAAKKKHKKAKKQAYSTVTSKKLPGFQLGVDDSLLSSDQSAPQSIARAREINASYVRVPVNWESVAPAGNTKPVGFDPRNPTDLKYKWAATDEYIKRTVATGMTVYVMLSGAPKWAQQGKAPADSGAGGGAWKPSAAEYGNFAHAAALRYNGSFPDPLTGAPLPRVKIWQAWNEPNLPLFLAPTSPELYRGLLNSFYDEIKAVQADSTIVTAGLAPVKSSAPAAFPKDFAEQLLCIQPDNGWFSAAPGCSAKAKFDIFSVHPYSLKASPTQRATIDGNLFVADVIDVSQMVRAAVQAKTVEPAGDKGLWSTEFAWFTNPPSATVGDDPARAGRRTAVALYQLWRAGLSQVTWFAISDNSAAIIKGGGFWDSSGHPKPTRDALRFPFYISQSKHVGYVWGRAPLGNVKRVFIQRLGKNGYKTVYKLTPRADGLFSLKFRLKTTNPGTFRAQQVGTYSLPLPSTGASN